MSTTALFVYILCNTNIPFEIYVAPVTRQKANYPENFAYWK